jgi:hypothetical protein
MKFVVGAYASLPQAQQDQEKYYDLLGKQDWIKGTELPFPGNLRDADQRTWLAVSLPKQWHRNTVTAIPGTMQNVWKTGTFGLASPDEEGRASAIAFFKELHDALADFAALRGANDISFIEIHSAPTKIADAAAMQKSLGELLSWDWNGSSLVIEHCDKYVEGQKPEKGFLSIEQEIELCRVNKMGMTINWGRSSVEGHDAATPEEHIKLATKAGVLTGLMFSGAGPEATQYGYEWIDGHLPMNPDEKTSLMGGEEIRRCTTLACSQVPTKPSYIGAKVVVPKDASLEERLSFLEHIYGPARI